MNNTLIDTPPEAPQTNTRFNDDEAQDPVLHFDCAPTLGLSAYLGANNHVVLKQVDEALGAEAIIVLTPREAKKLLSFLPPLIQAAAQHRDD